MSLWRWRLFHSFFSAILAVLPSSKRRFTNYLKRIFVQMTDTRGVVKEAVEWSKSNASVIGDSMDGFEIKRRGTVRNTHALFAFAK